MRIEHNSDRRVFDRFTTSLPVRFSSEMLDFDAQAELEHGSVENISRGGLFIRSEFLEVPGTPVLLVVTVPGTGETVRLSGHVAWITDEPPAGPGMGIRLTGTLLEQSTVDRLSQLA